MIEATTLYYKSGDNKVTKHLFIGDGKYFWEFSCNDPDHTLSPEEMVKFVEDCKEECVLSFSKAWLKKFGAGQFLMLSAAA